MARTHASKEGMRLREGVGVHSFSFAQLRYLSPALSYTLDHPPNAFALAQLSCKRNVASLTVVRLVGLTVVRQVSLSQCFLHGSGAATLHGRH